MSDDLRELLVAAARELLKDPDVDSLDLREVARRAGKSRTAPYVAWGSREEGGGLEALRIAVAASGFRDLAEGLRAAQRAAIGESLARVGEEYFAFAQENPRLFRIMFGPEVARGLERLTEGAGAHPEVERLLETRGEAHEAIRAALERDLDRGSELGIGTRDAALAAWAMFHGAAMLLIDGQFEVENLAPNAAKELVLAYLLSAPVTGLVEAAGDLSRAKQAKGHTPERLTHSEDAPVAGEESWFGGSAALARVRRNVRAMEGARILWIDDHPEWSAHEERFFERLGAQVVRALDIQDALEAEGPGEIDLIVTDIARERSDRAGLDDLPRLEEALPGVPVVFYVGRVDPDRPTPPGSFGITDDPEELIHLVLDILERTRF